MKPTPTPSIAGGRVSPFVLLCGVGFLGRLSYEMLRSPITSLFAKKIGAPTEIIGLLVASVTITGIFVKLPSGSLADLFGFRRLMQAGLWAGKPPKLVHQGGALRLAPRARRSPAERERDRPGTRRATGRTCADGRPHPVRRFRGT